MRQLVDLDIVSRCNPGLTRVRAAPVLLACPVVRRGCRCVLKVRCVCVLEGNVIVTGSDDFIVKMWALSPVVVR